RQGVGRGAGGMVSVEVTRAARRLLRTLFAKGLAGRALLGVDDGPAAPRPRRRSLRSQAAAVLLALRRHLGSSGDHARRKLCRFPECVASATLGFSPSLEWEFPSPLAGEGRVGASKRG